MLFKPEHRQMILNGTKTATRRVWKKPHVKVGNVYGCRLGKDMLVKDSDFARVRVTSLYPQALKNMNQNDAIMEGYDSIDDFKRIWNEINGEWKPDLVVWVIEFELVPEETT